MVRILKTIWNKEKPKKAKKGRMSLTDIRSIKKKYIETGKLFKTEEKRYEDWCIDRLDFICSRIIRWINS
jgi:hypothetical protein